MRRELFKRVRSTRDLNRRVIPPFVIRDLLAVGRSLGFDSDRWLRGTGLTFASLESPSTRISWNQGAAVISTAQAEAADEPLGLLVAQRETLSSYGLLGFAILAAPTLQDALLVGVQYHQHAGSLLDVGFQIAGDDVFLFAESRAFASDPVLAFLCEELLGGLVICLRGLLGPGFSPLGVELAYTQPRYHRKYADIFGRSIQFDAPSSRIRFPRRWLAWRMPSGNPISFAQAVAICEQAVDGYSDASPSFAAEVQTILVAESRAIPTVASLCARLGVSQRTLRRRLSSEGTSYRKLSALAMQEAADDLLECGRSVQETAAELGYSDPRDFRRAFKRATGSTPSRRHRLG